MVTPGLVNEQRITGILLILAFIAFAIGGTLPVVGEKGNARIFTLPIREHLQAIANNALVWRWANVFMGMAAILLLAGLWMLTVVLARANERVISRLGLATMLVATVTWIIFSAFRGIVTVSAAEEMTAKGTVPAYYESLALWGFRLFFTYAALGFIALVAYGVSLLQVELLPVWVGWVTIVFSLGLLILLFIMGDTLPGFHYLPGLLIGALLLLSSPQ